MSKKEKLVIVLPARALDGDKLVALTEYLTKTVFKGKWLGGGILGGEYGYGVDYENDTFMMHHYCWCENDDCKWCGEEDAPNFLYKPTDTKIWWYKWIGRDQRQEGKLPKGWYQRCIKSIQKGDIK